MVDPVSMRIAIISHEIPSGAVKLVKMFRLGFLEIKLNKVPETVIFGVCGYVLIELVYRVLVEDVMASRLNVCCCQRGLLDWPRGRARAHSTYLRGLALSVTASKRYLI